MGLDFHTHRPGVGVPDYEAVTAMVATWGEERSLDRVVYEGEGADAGLVALKGGNFGAVQGVDIQVWVFATCHDVLSVDHYGAEHNVRVLWADCGEGLETEVFNPIWCDDLLGLTYAELLFLELRALVAWTLWNRRYWSIQRSIKLSIDWSLCWAI